MARNHWMMFGTFTEQRHFIYPAMDTYEGVIVNANMAAHARDGIAKFIQTKTLKQKYIIDPQTHAFQHNPKHIQTDVLVDEVDEETGEEAKRKSGEKKLKHSIEKLVEQYGDPVAALAGKRPVTAKTFEDRKTMEGFTARCIGFQRDFLASRMLGSEDSKYTAFEAEGNENLSPYALIPPYFFMQETTYKEWLHVNTEATNLALQTKSKGEQVFAMIVISKGILGNPEILQQIVAAYRAMKVDGYIVWVDDFAEFAAGSAELRALLKMACGLNKSSDTELINLHGSFFSVLATSPKWKRRSFTGVCHGPEFGEHRSVVPVGGGIPIARYYVPDLHQRIRYREAAELLREMDYLKSAKDFYTHVCNCQECRTNIGDKPDENFVLYGESTPKKRKTRNGFVRIDYPTVKAKLRCLRHYLQQKNVEYRMAGEASVKDFGKELQKGIERYGQFLGSDATEHLELWKKVLFEYLDET